MMTETKADKTTELAMTRKEEIQQAVRDTVNEFVDGNEIDLTKSVETAIVVCRFQYGMSYRETASFLDVPLSRVTATLHSGKMKKIEQQLIQGSFRRKLLKAQKNLEELMLTARSEKVRLDATIEWLKQSGLEGEDKVVTSSGTISVDISL